MVILAADSTDALYREVKQRISQMGLRLDSVTSPCRIRGHFKIAISDHVF